MTMGKREEKRRTKHSIVANRQTTARKEAHNDWDGRDDAGCKVGRKKEGSEGRGKSLFWRSKVDERRGLGGLEVVDGAEGTTGTEPLTLLVGKRRMEARSATLRARRQGERARRTLTNACQYARGKTSFLRSQP
jgi:hypothetical protein